MPSRYRNHNSDSSHSSSSSSSSGSFQFGVEDDGWGDVLFNCVPTMAICLRGRSLALFTLIALVSVNLIRTIQTDFNVRFDSLLLNSPLQSPPNGYMFHNVWTSQDDPRNNNNEEEALPFQPSKYDYRAPPVKTSNTLPDPVLKEDPNGASSKLLVFVMSARSHFLERRAIRESWGKDHTNILFVIGGPEPDKSNEEQSRLLFQEQKKHNDILDTIHPETYRSLPYKLHYTFAWIRKQILLEENNSTSTSSSSQAQIAKNFEWFCKVDDDVVARLHVMERILLRQYNSQHPIVIGDIINGTRPQRLGKWAEDPHFKREYYPPWPRGAVAYVVSKPVADYIGRTEDLYYYQGEDAGLGIWLDEAHKHFGGDLTWINTPAFKFNGLFDYGFHNVGCSGNWIVIGHDFSPERIKECYEEVGGDRIPPHKSRIYRQKQVHFHGLPKGARIQREPKVDYSMFSGRRKTW